MSKSEARRKIKEGGFKVNGIKLNEAEWFNMDDFSCDVSQLDNAIVQFGKRKFRKFKWVDGDFQIWG